MRGIESFRELRTEMCLIYYPYYVDKEIMDKIITNISMLGIYLSYLEMNGFDYKVDCRPNNKFYINKCAYHNSTGEDYPFVIHENNGLFVCHGCAHAGSIIDFVADAYGIELDDILTILLSFIDGRYDELSPSNREIYNQLFSLYFKKDMYISKSFEKEKKIR